MPIPKYEAIMLPLLKRMAAIDGEATVADVLPDLAQEFGLTEDELQERLPSGGQTYFTNRCHWAKFYLTRAGLLEGERRGYFRITVAGRRFLKEKSSLPDRKSLMAIPQFAEWWNRAPDNQTAAKHVDMVDAQDIDTVTPDEQIDSAAKQIDAALVAELLTRVRAVSATQFEQIVVDLLIKMGFGGGEPEKGLRSGRSGDGGIDGVIQGDALGLDAVYIQAKRYAEGMSIGRPQLQAFIGSLVGERATKGVFVTTSAFTRDARDYVKTVQHRVVLIDGEELAKFLVRYSVGVREDRRVVIKRLDEDYFADV
jgi:restriction system protein